MWTSMLLSSCFSMSSFSISVSVLLCTVHHLIRQSDGQNLAGLVERNLPFRLPFGTLSNYKKHSVINGATVLEGDIAQDTRDLLLQKTTTGGSEYYEFHNQKVPIYRRREIDVNKHYVTFPDPLFPEGSGRYILLRKLMTKSVAGVILPLRDPVYQKFRLVLEDTLHAFLSKWVPHNKLVAETKEAKEKVTGKGIGTGMTNGNLKQASYKIDIEFSDDGYGQANMGMTNRLKRDTNFQHEPSDSQIIIHKAKFKK